MLFCISTILQNLTTILHINAYINNLSSNTHNKPTIYSELSTKLLTINYKLLTKNYKLIANYPVSIPKLYKFSTRNDIYTLY